MLRLGDLGLELREEGGLGICGMLFGIELDYQ